MDSRALGLRDKWRADVPVLYDFLLNHHEMWPSLSCRWGSVGAEHGTYSEQRLFLSEQTDGSMPNTILIATVAIPKQNQTRAEQLLEDWDEDSASDLLGIDKTIFHPGEVNRIRELPQHPHIVATHTDAPEVLVWNTDTQDNRRGEAEGKDDLSSPDLVLTGHDDNAEFALCASSGGPFLLSGGRDTHVVLWCLEDTVVNAPTSLDSRPLPTIPSRSLFKGHRDTVEDVQFRPGSTVEFCSVGDDLCLLLWDTRTGSAPVVRVERAHKKDVHCVDWSPHSENLLLTGSADCSVRLFDKRRMSAKGHSNPVHTFANMHYDAVVAVQWSPHASAEWSTFASAGDDGVVNVVNTSTQEVQFKHLGHKDKISDMHWNPQMPFTLLSCSVDSGKTGGGTVQVWRPIELFQLSEDDALERLDTWQAT